MTAESIVNFSLNISKYLSTKVPCTEVKNYIISKPDKIIMYIEELNIAINTYNQFRHDPEFPHKELYINAHELNNKLPLELPLFTYNLSDKVYIHLRDNSYFQAVWQIRPINYLIINILILVYRTNILFDHNLFDKTGHQTVQISSALEEMIFHQYLDGNQLSIFTAVNLWLKDWQDEGFSQELYKLIIEQ